MRYAQGEAEEDTYYSGPLSVNTEIPRGEFLCDRHLCVCVMESAEVEMWVEVERLINNSSKASANAQREIRRGWFEVRMSHRRGSEASKVVLCWEGD